MTIRSFVRSSVLATVLVVSGCAHPGPVPTPIPPVCASPSCTHAQFNVSVSPAGSVVTIVPDLFPAVGGVEVSPGRYTIIIPGEYQGTGESLTVTAPGYSPYSVRPSLVQSDGSCGAPQPMPAWGSFEICPGVVLHPTIPAPYTRDYILSAHESFQGAWLNTTQFGRLPWYPSAWISLNDEDRLASYAQIAAWGDTGITISTQWDYGEPGQPYGTGQLVPGRDLTQDWPTFRALVKEVIQHKTRDGNPFVAIVKMGCDGQYDVCLNTMIPGVKAALAPQPNDPLDLVPYVKFRLCYDSCIPGYQPPSQVEDIILAARAAFPNGVIGIEFATGYTFYWHGAADFTSPAGQALDEVSWEGNQWPSDNLDQYWSVLDRWLGPCFKRPPQMPDDIDPTAPFQPGDGRWYLAPGTPRGPFHVDIFEPYTYQWVRSLVSDQGVIDNRNFIFSMLQSPSCASVDVPQPVQ